MKRIYLLSLTALLLLAACAPKAEKFVIGADISFVPEMEKRGAVFHDSKGKVKDVVAIMSDYGFNTIRLRIFVDPSAPNGYSRDGFCDLEHTLAMARRIKSAGMQFALDFHYSDYWADPDKQYKPSSWQSFTGASLDSALYEYTKDVLLTLKQEGVPPSIVQIGNEINHGFVWPEGRIDDHSTEANWEAMCALYKSGQRAVFEVLPEAKLMVHLALGGQNGLCHQFLDHMETYGARFDIIGVSYYDQWHGTLEDLKNNLDDLSAHYQKPVCVCEYSKPHIREINDIVHSVPDGLGYGTMYWEPILVLFSSEDMTRRMRLEGWPSQVAQLYKNIAEQYADPNTQISVPTPVSRDFPDLEKWQNTDFRTASDWVYLPLVVDSAATADAILRAKEAKANGKKVLLALYYSDIQTSPENQPMPASWEGKRESALEGEIYGYSYRTVKLFVDNDATPDIVQIGNQVNNGMVWPQGRIGEGAVNNSFISFGILLRCASAGVRAADPNIKVLVNIRKDKKTNSQEFFDKVRSRDVIFDLAQCTK